MKVSNDTIMVIEEDIDYEHLLDRLEGRNGGLRPSKPTANGDNGLVRYLWRYARFYSGQDTCLPMTAEFDLMDYLEDDKGLFDNLAVVPRDIRDYLNEIAEDLAEDLTGERNGDVKRWSGLL